ncbi:MAG: hypothetical protein AABZ39_14965 [Spirochaetota bacterium]
MTVTTAALYNTADCCYNLSMNVLRNLRAFFIAYLTLASITLFYLLIKARVHVNPFAAFALRDMQGILYQFALFYFFTLSPIIGMAALMLARSCTIFRGGVIARTVTMASIAVIAAAYPIYIRYVHASTLDKEFRAFDIPVVKKYLSPGGFITLDAGKIRIGTRDTKDRKYDYRDVTYIPAGASTVYHAAYGIQKPGAVLLTRVNAYSIETGASRDLTEFTVPLVPDERPNVIVERTIAGLQWLTDIPKRIGKKKGAVRSEDPVLSKIFSRFSDSFFLFDTLLGFPLILTMRDVFTASLRVIPYAQFVPVFTFAIFLLLASAYHLIHSLAVPRLTFHNIAFVVILWLLFQAVFAGIADAVALPAMLKRATMLQMLFGYAGILAGINLIALFIRFALSFSTYYRRASA